ncbi:MAG TPA: universal stress protein [Dongiaceae bacterium]|jgi:nucleotide-binding universal stress UspA family protein|nr:universal stress protein [Dongiaceae bacterium]
MFERIAIAHDGSDGAARAFAAALDLAKRHKARLLMVSVEELPRFPTTMDELVEESEEAGHRFAQLIETCQAQARIKRVKVEPHVVPGHAVTSIVEFVEQNRCDLLVVGFMGHSALYNRLIGGTTDRLVELAPCAILVVK